MSEFDQSFSRGKYLNVGYVEDDIVKGGTEFCPNCKCYQKSFRVEGFADPIHKKATFCDECGFLLRKPLPFGWLAFPGLKLLLRYSGDRFFLRSNDYGKRINGELPEVFYHFSNYDGKFQEMRIKETENNGIVDSLLLGCEKCHEESVINFQMIN